MFGYVLPVKPELRVRELDRFQAVYCGLCHAIRAKYGMYHTFFLSYDMTFLALVLTACADEDAGEEPNRCGIHRFRKETIAKSSAEMELAADLSVALIRYKLEDDIQDDTGAKRLVAQTLRLLGHNGFHAAEEAQPAFCRTASSCMHELSDLERSSTPSLDRTADAFARLTAAMIPNRKQEETRVLQHMFYHLGRWIYLIDAVHDLKQDFEKGEYNPIISRFSLDRPDITPIKETIELTLSRSLLDIHNSFQLLNIRRDGGLLENIIDLGLPLVTRQVLDGIFDLNGGTKKHGPL